MKQFSRAQFLFALSGKSVDDKSSDIKPALINADAAVKPSSAGIAPYRGAWGQKQILHLLRRSLFGVSHADLNHFANLNLSECLDILLTASPKPPPPVNAYNDGDFIDPVVPFGQTWINARPDPSKLDEKRTLSLKAWWVALMFNQERNLTEKMTLFWSNYLATQAHTVLDSRYDYQYVALLRSYALSNFKHLVREVTTNLAMLLHLNGDLNTVSAPNENYGREMQELFTVGKGPDSHYTQSDVEAASRVLTGWGDGPTAVPSLVFRPANHDTGNKQFSAFYNNTLIKGRTGLAGAYETDDLINMIFGQKETARYFCRKLYRWFVYYVIDDDIEKNIISPLADILINNNFEVKPVVKALLESEHFFDSLNMGCQIKNPVDLLIGACRQFQVNFPPAADIKSQYEIGAAFVNRLKLSGMEPDEPLNVAGWPAYSQAPAYYQNWINSNTLAERNSITDELASQNGMKINTNVIRFDLLAFTSQLSNPANPDELILDSTILLSPNRFDAKEKVFLKRILLSGQIADSNWTVLWNAYIADPTDLSSRSAILNRLTQYYTYILQRPEYQLI
jgi:uncharacterized protein (DUF1800 family)